MNVIAENFVITSFKRSLRKLLLLLVFVCSSCLLVAQNPDNNISFRIERCSLEVALQKLYEECGVKLAFNRDELSGVVVNSYSADGVAVEQILASLLNGSGLSYKKIGGQYVIKRDINSNVTAPPKKNIEVTQEKSKPITPSAPKPQQQPQPSAPDTIRVVDTIVKKEIVYRVDTIREKEVVVQTDTVVVYKYTSSKIKKLRKNIFANDYSHHKDFSLSFSAYQSVALYSDKRTNGTEFWYEFYEKSFQNFSLRNYAVKVNGAYTYNRFQFGLGVSFSSFQRRLDFHRDIVTGGYYEVTLLDTYYVVDPITNDVSYYNIYDSTFIPRQVQIIEYVDNNRLGYLGLNADVAYSYYADDNVKLYIKAGFGASFLLYFNGSLIGTQEPFMCIDDTDKIQKFKLNAMAGLGARITLSEQVEFVPEISYHNYFGSVYTDDSPVSSHIDVISLGIGLIYYF